MHYCTIIHIFTFIHIFVDIYYINMYRPKKLAEYTDLLLMKLIEYNLMLLLVRHPCEFITYYLIIRLQTL